MFRQFAINVSGPGIHVIAKGEAPFHMQVQDLTVECFDADTRWSLKAIADGKIEDIHGPRSAAAGQVLREPSPGRLTPGYDLAIELTDNAMLGGVVTVRYVQE